MRRCWVLIVTRGLGVWLPPEVYLLEDLAVRESARWRSVMRIPAEQSVYSRNARLLHLTQTSFPESWRACPAWVGVKWSERDYPRLRITLMAADDQEAVEWLHRRTPKALRRDRSDQVQFQSKGVLTSVGVFRAKRVMGF